MQYENTENQKRYVLKVSVYCFHVLHSYFKIYDIVFIEYYNVLLHTCHLQLFFVKILH